MSRKKIRIRIACTLAFALAAALIGPRIDLGSTQAKSITSYASTGTVSGIFRYMKVIDPANTASSKKYSDIAARRVNTIADDDKIINALGNTMTTQLNSFLGNTGAASTYISDVTGSELASLNEELKKGGFEGGYTDIVTKVKFTIPAGTFPDSVTKSGDTLFYLEQAISRFPTLCCLFTMSIYDRINNTLTVYSPVPKNKLGDTISEYTTTLNDMLEVPKKNTSMSETDKLLYLHDQVVALTEYSVGRSDTHAADYIPAGAMVYNLGVCQSYAAVYNQAARELGLTSYVLYSENHAWVAVRLGGNWYYVDPTWDDTRTVGESADKVKHTYLFVGKNEITNDSYVSYHELTDEYKSHFSEITGSLGSSYKDYYPKKNSITSQMGYANGVFFYADNNEIYQWPSNKTTPTRFAGLPSASSRRAAVLNGYVFISGSTGIYKMDPSGAVVLHIDTTSITGMYEAAKKLYVSRGGAYSIYIDQSSPITSPSPGPTYSSIPTTPLPSGYTPLPYTTSPSPSATSSSKIPTVPPLPTATIYDPTVVSPTPSASASATPTATDYPDDDSFTTPAKTKIKTLKNSAKKAAYIKWKKISGVSKYQVQYSTSSSFSSKRTRESLTSSVTIVNLSKKTYYFRVRSVKVKRVDGEIKYKLSAWSSKKKLKIKK